MQTKLPEILKKAQEFFQKKSFAAALELLLHNEPKADNQKVSDTDFINYQILLGEAYWHTGNLQGAKKAFDKGLNKTKGDLPPKLKAEIQNNSALIEKNLGFYETSLEKYYQSKAIYEEAKMTESPHYLHLLNNLAILLKDMGRLSEAEELFLTTLRKIESIPTLPDVFQMRVENNYAALCSEKGDFEQSKKHYFHSMQARVKKYGNQSPQYAESLNNLAVLYSEIDNKKAKSILEKSLGICKALFGEADLRTAKTKKNLAVTKIRIKEYAKARNLLVESLEVIKSKTGSQSPLYWKSLKELAISEWKSGNLSQAEKLFEDVKGFFQEKQEIYTKEAFLFFYDYSRYLFDIGKLKEAFFYLISAVKFENEYFEKIIKGLDEDSALKLINQMFSQTGFFISSLLKHKDEIKLSNYYPLLFFRKGLVFEVTFLHRLKTRLSKDKLLKTKFDNYAKARKEIARRLFTGAVEREDIEYYSNRQKTLIKKCVELERELRTVITKTEIELSDDISSLSVLNKKIGENDLILDYYKYQSYDFKNGEYTKKNQYVVFFVHQVEKELKISLNPLSSAEEMEKDITHYRKIISGDEDTRGSGHSRLTSINEIITVCKTLYDNLLPRSFIRIAKEKNETVKTAHICPDGEISTIVFESLISPEDDFFLDNFHVNYYTSIREMSRDEKTPRKLTDVILFANPEYELDESETKPLKNSGNHKRESGLLNLLREKTSQEGYYGVLDGTQKEGNLLEKLFKESTIDITAFYTGKRASEKNLKRIKSPSILHLATHGFFISNENKNIPHPLFRSGIVLSGVNSVLKGKTIPEEYEDGVFSAYDATTLSIENTEIVVLSACETGLGEIKTGEGILGLRRSFAQSGAKTIIMSLWRVSDKYTVYMMESFYKNLLKGEKIPEALRNAQLDLIEFLDDTFGFASPALWAGFICQGNYYPITVQT